MRLFLPVTVLLALTACSPDTPSAPEAIVNAQTAAVTETEKTPTPVKPPVPNTDVFDEIDFTAYSRELAKFTGLKEGQSRVEAIDNVRLYFTPEKADTILRTSQRSIERDEETLLIFSAEGFADDAIKGEEIYLLLSGDEDHQKLAAYGSRLKCWRGENTTEWQTEACP
jgi:hypothetical protein